MIVAILGGVAFMLVGWVWSMLVTRKVHKYNLAMTSIFKIEKIVDAESGKTILSVTANGKDCETFTLEGKIAKRYIGFSLIFKDLEDALWWLCKAYSLLPSKSKSDDQDDIKTAYTDSTGDELFRTLKAYYYSSIITYGKCFAATEERGIKLEAKDHIEEEFKPCHEKIMNYRNNLVAHAGSTFDSGEVIVAPNPIGPEFHVAPNLWRLDFEDDREIEIGFEELIVHVKDNVDKIQKKILDRLLTGEARDAVIQRKSSK